jgi:hypothetical protein
MQSNNVANEMLSGNMLKIQSECPGSIQDIGVEGAVFHDEVDGLVSRMRVSPGIFVHWKGWSDACLGFGVESLSGVLQPLFLILLDVLGPVAVVVRSR